MTRALQMPHGFADLSRAGCGGVAPSVCVRSRRKGDGTRAPNGQLPASAS